MIYTYAEMHFHTSETSKCGEVSAYDSIPLFKEHGYDLVCVTDHFNERYFEPSTSKEHWRRQCEKWFAGWYAAREAGEKYGVTVLHGAEIQFRGNYSEMLVYGIPDETMLDVPELFNLAPEEFFALARENGCFVSAAHPFRHSPRYDPSLYDGAEVFNYSESFRENNNRNAEEFARANGLVPTCGQDFHELNAMHDVKTRFNGEVRDMRTLIDKLLARDFVLLLPEGRVLDPKNF